MTHPSDIAGLSPIDRIRLALHLSEGYDVREFECEPEYIEALLTQYDEAAAELASSSRAGEGVGGDRRDQGKSNL